MDTIENILGRIKDLPTLPAVIRQVSELIESNESDMKRISDVIMTDTALSLRIIRLVNSAFYGLRNRVASLHQAVVALGLRAVYNLMLGLTVVKLFQNEKSLHFDPALLWRHSFGCALLSEKTAHCIAYPFPDECFIAGLLHDMGRLAFDQYLHDEFAEACLRAADGNISLLKSEKEVIGFDHAEAGAWLARKMLIPEPFVSVIRYHHTPSLLPDELEHYRDIVRITATANRTSFIENVGDSGEHVYEDDPDLLRLEDLGIDISQLARNVNVEVNAAIARWNP